MNSFKKIWLIEFFLGIFLIVTDSQYFYFCIVLFLEKDKTFN